MHALNAPATTAGAALAVARAYRSGARRRLRPWRVHVDDSLHAQPALAAGCALRDGRELDLRGDAEHARLWCRPAVLARLRDGLDAAFDSHPAAERRLVFLGSGDFHHLSALLVERVAASARRPFTVVHFDHHPDWVRFDDGLHCGSWAAYAARLPAVARVVTAGVGSADLRWPEFKRADLDLVRSGAHVVLPLEARTSWVLGEYSSGVGHSQRGRRLAWRRLRDDRGSVHAGPLLEAIATDHVYVTIDKDVLGPADAATNWDQGTLTLDELLGLLRALLDRHELLGADVVGDASPIRYAGPAFERIAKRAESLADQPRVIAADARPRNEYANLALLLALADA